MRQLRCRVPRVDHLEIGLLQPRQHVVVQQLADAFAHRHLLPGFERDRLADRRERIAEQAVRGRGVGERHDRDAVAHGAEFGQLRRDPPFGVDAGTGRAECREQREGQCVLHPSTLAVLA